MISFTSFYFPRFIVLRSLLYRFPFSFISRKKMKVVSFFMSFTVIVEFNCDSFIVLIVYCSSFRMGPTIKVGFDPRLDLKSYKKFTKLFWSLTNFCRPLYSIKLAIIRDDNTMCALNIPVCYWLVAILSKLPVFYQISAFQTRIESSNGKRN